MEDLRIIAKEAGSILIAGHKKPDGDCTGACIAAYHYLKNIYPEKKIIAYLEELPEKFSFLDEGKKILSGQIPKEPFDLAIAVDTSTADYLGHAQEAFCKAEETVCIDHHISNCAYAGKNYIDPSASSACQVLYGMMVEEEIDREIADALYIGMMCDSGLFRYSNTSKETMEIAGALMEKGVPFTDYIDHCFCERSYIQTQLLGKALLASMRLMDGKCVIAAVTRQMLKFYGAEDGDTEGIIDQLRVIKGVEVAILMHEIGNQQYKVSMRSNHYIDVSRVAAFFGGGGHVRAAGCTMQGTMHDVANNLTEHIEVQMKG